MSIKGLTDEARYPVIGHLRKGDKKTSDTRPGKDLDHFRFTSEEPELENTFLAIYGAQPSEMEVYLPYPTTEENLDAWMEEYVAGGLVRRCDGETCLLHRLKDGTMSDEPVGCMQHESDPCACKETGRLHVLLPELEHLAVVLVHTTSIHDIRNLHGSLSRYEQEAVRSGGSLMGIPFTLRRVKRKISTPGAGGKRARREKWLLAIEPSPRWVSLRLAEAKERALADGTSALGDGHSRELAEPGRLQLPASGVDPSASEVVVEGQAVGSPKIHQPTPLTSADPTVIKELQTACTDFGFLHADRELRLGFASLYVCRDVESFKDLSNGEASRLMNLVLYVMRRINEASIRRSFAAFCVREGVDISDVNGVSSALATFAEEYMRADYEALQAADRLSAAEVP